MQRGAQHVEPSLRPHAPDTTVRLHPARHLRRRHHVSRHIAALLARIGRVLPPCSSHRWSMALPLAAEAHAASPFLSHAFIRPTVSDPTAPSPGQHGQHDIFTRHWHTFGTHVASSEAQE